jgi:hypothetical protein
MELSEHFGVLELYPEQRSRNAMAQKEQQRLKLDATDRKGCCVGVTKRTSSKRLHAFRGLLAVAVAGQKAGGWVRDSLHAVARKVRDDICLKLFRRSEVGRTLTRVAPLESG